MRMYKKEIFCTGFVAIYLLYIPFPVYSRSYQIFYFRSALNGKNVRRVCEPFKNEVVIPKLNLLNYIDQNLKTWYKKNSQNLSLQLAN